MPSTTKTAADDLQGQILDTIRQGQEAAVEALRAWTETAEQFLPRTGRRPGADRLPTATELVDNAYDFASELLKVQRDFAHKALAVTAPLYDRVEEQAAKAADRAKS